MSRESPTAVNVNALQPSLTEGTKWSFLSSRVFVRRRKFIGYGNSLVSTGERYSVEWKMWVVSESACCNRKHVAILSNLVNRGGGGGEVEVEARWRSYRSYQQRDKKSDHLASKLYRDYIYKGSTMQGLHLPVHCKWSEHETIKVILPSCLFLSSCTSS